MKIAADKWEAPDADRKLWRRRKDDGSYEYRESPPEEGVSQAQQQQKPTPKLKWVPDKDAKHIEPKHIVRLDKPLLHEVLSKGYFTVLSAGRNPNDPAESRMKEDDAYFHERHLALRDELERLDAPYTEVVGHYGGRESSFIVFHDDTMLPPETAKSILVHYEKDSVEKNRKDMETLGEKFNQDSVLHGDNGQNEIAFTTGEKKGKNCGSRGWEEVPDAEDFFTDIELDKTQHTKVRLNIEDCFKRHLLSRMEGDMKEQRIASRIVADYGDTQAYFNTFDYFDLDGADHLSIKQAQAVLSNAVLENSEAFRTLVKRTLQRRDKAGTLLGLKLKR